MFPAAGEPLLSPIPANTSRPNRLVAWYFGTYIPAPQALALGTHRGFGTRGARMSPVSERLDGGAPSLPGKEVGTPRSEGGNLTGPLSRATALADPTLPL